MPQQASPRAPGPSAHPLGELRQRGAMDQPLQQATPLAQARCVHSLDELPQGGPMAPT
eukprot:CAMPEP_0119113386 /NCGR_PEP_ID=MMETSP1180-20130426/43771_1 /TAXON_ID=3052 ORGANISM="Chlamydomonas cf sp, Strain CCMP681" /NCGR_SAMPLE_ID=MMETSP1180 /ASSEMBLY_ACC=CAM_ASM_000741 /LENGTH=57 /DNA_ID=CAMNT_0007101419 /DNA_START=65 /DNA_END=234 /DNA_ORIENTATION=-